MAGAVHFLMIDFKSGFWQVQMAPGSQQYTAYTVGNLGFYEFTLYALWPLQHACDLPMPYAEHPGGVEPNILCHLPR